MALCLVRSTVNAFRNKGRSEHALRVTWTGLWLCCTLIGCGLVWCTHAQATAAASTEPVAALSENDLPPLPTPPKLEPLPPEPADVEELDARITRLQSDRSDERKDAVSELLEVRPKLLAAVLGRLERLAAHADRERMKRALSQVREKSNRVANANDTNSRGASESRNELLVQLVEQARPKDEGWRDLVELVAISRMLTQIGNVQAARGLVDIYVRFGEFMRVDVQNRLSDLREGAVAALIEARRHRAEKVARWAERQLDRLGKGVPSEAIRTEDFEVLADVLRAYGRTKDPDAARIIVSYSSSERYQIREAARQALVMLGEVGIWQLRDAYENVVGKRPRRDWSWERTARELLHEYDRMRTEKVHSLLEEGRRAESEGRLEDMAKAYDALLARSPQFEKAPSLGGGYFKLAEQCARDRPAAAEAALVRVERLTDDSALRQRAKSLRDTIRAEQLLSKGVVDTYLLRNAVERDPTNGQARRLLASVERTAVEAQAVRTRWLTSGAIAAVTVAAILFVLLHRRDHRKPGDVVHSTEHAPAPKQRSNLDGSDLVPPQPGMTPQLASGQERVGDESQSSLGAEATQQAATDASDPMGDSVEAPPKRRDPFEDL